MRCGNLEPLKTAMGQTRSFGDVNFDVGFPQKADTTGDLWVHALKYALMPSGLARFARQTRPLPAPTFSCLP